ncbi:hypothetical protein L1987_43948 [Smallanthus sonchifolius]|uniref:Uncharacterized protein n=1 Tax=Smallanthus sonchifolius TaxID=185202 RepID=A0ACB9GQ46_9ASTR|nr:hypothetical protein L1987_43948 [Smallanthus sonchifolius]
MSSSSSQKAFTIVALLFLLLSTGFSRKLMQSTTTGDGFASPSPPSPFEESGGKSREMIELDYDDAGPNTNRSGVILPTPDPDAPAPQP